MPNDRPNHVPRREQMERADSHPAVDLQHRTITLFGQVNAERLINRLLGCDKPCEIVPDETGVPDLVTIRIGEEADLSDLEDVVDAWQRSVVDDPDPTAGLDVKDYIHDPRDL